MKVASDTSTQIPGVRLIYLRITLIVIFSFPHVTYFYYFYFQGVPDMSDYAISFHYLPPKELYVLDFLIYGIKHAGVQAPHNDKLV